MSTLLRVTTPTACGGLVIEPGPDGAVTTAAPFLEDFLGLTEFEVYADCNDRGWHVEILPVDPLAPDLLGTRATVQPEREFVHRLEGLLWPERFPPGHARHDPDHVFWSISGEDGVYEWSADTIEWVSELVTKELEDSC